MGNVIKPWAVKAYELIYHAEIHYQRNEDYDRRLALVSFDNAIEVAIVVYLSLHPSQRGSKSYPKLDVGKWLHNYHTKIDFFFEEIARRDLPAHHEKESVIWYHQQRNEQYHGGGAGVPDQATLASIREVSLWFFSVLYDLPEIETYLLEDVAKNDSSNPTIPDEYAVPETPIEVEAKQTWDDGEPALIAALMAGAWDENNEADVEIVRKLADGL